jgi:VanZ family protein
MRTRERFGTARAVLSIPFRRADAHRVLGAALEGGQTFSPGRAVELSDLAANNLGVFCGLVLALPLR